jgi:hypothetical protein
MKTTAFLTALFLAFLVLEKPAEGQVRYRFFYGKVVEAETKKPISNVNISFKGSKMGSVSDQKGAFSFYIDTIPVTMIISHLGYKTKRILLDGKSNSMNLYLDKDIQELKEVEILSNKTEPFFKDEHYTIRDYEIDSGRVYLLVYRYNISKEELICKNLDGDTVARSGILPFTPLSILKDCLGYLHIVGKDSVFQVYLRDKTLEMIHPVGMEKFNEVLLNCVASTDRVLFFKKMIKLGQGVQYYGIDRVTLKRRELTQVVDEKKTKMLRLNPTDAYLLGTILPGGRSIDLEKEEETSQSIQMGREGFNNWNWVHKALYRPIKTALYRIGDYICIFDVPGKELEFFDPEGNFSYKLKISIDQIRDGRWSGDIFMDETQSKAYTTFLKSSGTNLYRIDLNTGDLRKILSIIHPYPQKIRVYKEQVYYLYDVLGDPDNKTLFRQKL